MHPDLDRLIKLQRLDDETATARTKIDAIPTELAALDGRVAAAEQALAAARATLDDNQLQRRAIEKDLAAVQTRLSRYRDQIMAVKTNKEYQAMQHEIATAESEVRAMEDRILDRMEEAESLAVAVKTADAALKTERTAVDLAKRELEGVRAALDAQIGESQARRAAIIADTGPEALALFEHVARTRKGVAVARAHNGHCTECHVRLRPQRDLEIRRNDSLIQCESCLRILYYEDAAGSAPAAQPGA